MRGSLTLICVLLQHEAHAESTSNAWKLKQALADHASASNDAQIQRMVNAEAAVDPTCKEFEPLFGAYIKYHDAAMTSLRSKGPGE
jgi:hypothetical protein